MLLSPAVMRVLLFACMLGMMVLAGFYLRHQRLSLVRYLLWGALILLAPLVGPFLVILLGARQSRESRTLRRRRRRHRFTPDAGQFHPDS